jgi:hypothetical protein
VKTAQNSQRSKASNAVLLTLSRAERDVKSFCGLEACSLVKTAKETKLNGAVVRTPASYTGGLWIKSLSKDHLSDKFLCDFRHPPVYMSKFDFL